MTAVRDELVRTLAEAVVTQVADRGEGHCLIVPHLPQPIADGACRLVRDRLAGGDARDHARTVVERPGEDWQASPTKAVELRNEVEQTGGRLVLFVPSGENLAAEDSFGPSTFEVFDVGQLERDAARRLERELERLDPQLAEIAVALADTVAGDIAFAVGHSERAAYLSRLVANPRRDEVGRALTEFGLLPDTAIASFDEETAANRLHRNLQQMRTLTEVAPPEERVRMLPLDRQRDETPGIVRALLDAASDGSTDRFELADRLGEDRRIAAVDFGEWQLDVTAIKFDEFSVLQLIGDFSGEVDRTVTKANASIGVRLRCRPAPANLTGLKELTLELLRVGEDLDDLAETGVQAARRGGRLPKSPETQWKLRLPGDNPDVGEGVYCFRVRGYNEDNLQVATARSEPFRIGEVEPPPRRVSQVASVTAAVVGAAAEIGPADSVGAPQITAAHTSPGLLSLAIRFERIPAFWELELSRTLVDLERYTLDDPESLGRYRVELGSDEVTSASQAGPISERFSDARSRLFAALASVQHDVEGANPGALVALADLTQVSDLVDEYVTSWADALGGAETEAELRALLSIDQIALDENGREQARLVGPTHPLRIAWLTRYQQRVTQRLRSGLDAAEVPEVERMLAALRPANVPFIVPGDRGPLRHVEPLGLHWGLWAPPDSRRSAVVSTRVRAWLLGERAAVGALAAGELATRIRRYLVAHPYVDLLVLNFVQPGLGQVILEALLSLQRETAFRQLRYVVRLFATELSRSELGAALDQFMTDPEPGRASRREEADAFLAAAEDPLAPKLTYSKHSVDDLVRDPEGFPAHLTVFLDWFDLRIMPSAPLGDRQSFFGQGLVVDPVVTFRSGGERMNPQWDAYVAGTSGADAFFTAYAAEQAASARLLGTSEPGLVPAVRLDLDRVKRSVLDAVHRTSDWVVVVDPVFSDELLDSPGLPGEAPRYLIDYIGDQGLATTRHVVVSTRSRGEIHGLLRPIAEAYGLALSDERAEVLLNALQVLGAGLPLKLLNNRAQGLEAFSLALASAFLAEQGIFRHALAIPLDMHQELFRERRARAVEEDVGLRRTDIALIRVTEESEEPRIRFGVSLVEVKARANLPDKTPPELVESVSEQLENSRSVLRARLFGADLTPPQRGLEATGQVKRLSRLLTHYAERAARYGYLDGDRLAIVRQAAASLEGSEFRLSFEKHALIFDLSGQSYVPERMEDVVVRRVGRAEVDEMLDRTRTPQETQPFEGDRTEILGGDPARTRPGGEGAEVVEIGVPPPAAAVLPDEAPTRDELPEQAVAGDEEGPNPEDLLLIGSVPSSNQFGVVGRLRGTGEAVAMDLDGTNTVCVFGAPGSGKSYTVGALLEAALMRDPALGRLPSPLAAVVFHYSTDESYAPEFVSMGEPNDDRHEVDRLRRDYGTAPERLRDLRVLVPDRRLDVRRDDYPHLEVHPLRLASAEIGLNEWQLLMGVSGGDQMYVRAMNRIFGSVRERISLEALQEAIQESTLTQHQKQLALTRLSFAETYVGDVSPLSEHLAPGRLLIVDLRDPLIADDEALALFMVLLRTFGQVSGPGDRPLNKMFVFDEAHKYMRDPQLRTAIDSAVRERRHRGTTIVVASQDPPSIPPEIVGLSNIVVAHTFNVPGWLDFLRKHQVAFAESELKPSQLSTLPSGEAYVWSAGGAEEFRRPQRVQVRPRLTRHGGGTRRATGWHA